MGSGSTDLRCVIGPYAFVGDLHGRVDLLKTILSKDTENKYHYVFLGDILHHKPFFRRAKRCSPIKILREVSDLIDHGRATLILGNNENYVLNALVMPKEDIKKKELKYTLECLRELPLNLRLKYISMLSNAPLHLELDNKYRVAHAYYPHNVDVPREHIIAGPGYAWFRDLDLSSHSIDPDFMYLFGHYGLPYRHQNIHILDATSLEATGVYYSDKDEMVIYY
jgi:hypothetical protein